MKLKIGVFGSAEGDFEKILDKAKELGRILGEKKVIVITGASSGLPYEVAKVAHDLGSEVWGFSKGINIESQEKFNPGLDSSIFSKLIYVPKDYEFVNNSGVCMKYRNVTSTANCDAGIIISGRWGTLNEFTNLFDMGKVIGVLIGSGGVADELEELSRKINKKTKSVLIFESDPKKLVNQLISELEKRQ